MEDNTEFRRKPQREPRRSLLTCRIEAVTDEEVTAYCINDAPGNADLLVTWQRADLPLEDNDTEEDIAEARQEAKRLFGED